MMNRISNYVVASLLALSLIAVACGSDTAVEDDIAAQASTTTTTAAAATTTTAAAATTTTAEVPEPTAEPAGDLDFAFQPVPPGEYTNETLGTPIELTIGENWFVQPNEGAFLVLTDPSSQGPGDRDVVFLRPTSLADPDNPSGEVDEQVGDWPLDDIDGWLDNLVDSVVVTNREAVMVGGRDAVRFDVEAAADAPCNDSFCVGFATARLVNNLAFDKDNTYQVYWIDGGAFEPIAISIGISTGGQDFLDKADELLASLVIGEPAPHPIPEGNPWELGFGALAPAGPIKVPTLGGLSFELSESLFLEQPADTVMFLFLDGPGEVNLIKIVADGEDNPIESIDEVVAVFESTGGTVTELDSVEIAGYTARVFDLVDTPEPNFALGPLLKDMVGGENGWFPPNRGRFRLFESERGLIMIGSESFEDDSLIDQTIEIGDVLASTLEFIDFTGPE